MDLGGHKNERSFSNINRILINFGFIFLKIYKNNNWNNSSYFGFFSVVPLNKDIMATLVIIIQTKYHNDYEW